MNGTVIPILIGALGSATKGLVHGQENLEIKGWVETIQTTALLKSAEKSAGDLERLAVAQTPVRNPQLTLVWKTLYGVNKDNTLCQILLCKSMFLQ